jgi:hypothetical protein
MELKTYRFMLHWSTFRKKSLWFQWSSTWWQSGTSVWCWE